MARDSVVSKSIYKRHIRLFRSLNDAWIFSELLRPHLHAQAKSLRASKSLVKRSYSVPVEDGKSKGNANISSMRLDSDVGGMFFAQHDRGVFETNIISLVSRTEAFIQDCIAIATVAFPGKLSLLTEKSGIPLDLFLENESREDVINRFVALKCEALMFAKPSEYIEKLTKVLAIPLDVGLVSDFLEIKASRDIIIHNNGRINKLYVEKAGEKARGTIGHELTVDHAYFRHVIVKLKRLSGTIQRETEKVYK